jgi:predicted secreted protein
MKQQSIIILLVCLFLGSISHGQEAISWSKSYHKIGTGSTLEITLDSNPSTGYNWFLTSAEQQYHDYLVLKAKDFLQDTEMGPVVGAAGRTRFQFQAAAAPIDSLILFFTYKRPWETETAAAYHIAVVTIVDSAQRKLCQPNCKNIGTDAEGWYSPCTQSLLKREKCGEMSRPYCGALKTRSEGWYSDQGLINYEFCFDARLSLPRCINEGQDNEGWQLADRFVKASCRGKKISCDHPLSKNEGFWAHNGGGPTLVTRALCMLEKK